MPEEKKSEADEATATIIEIDEAEAARLGVEAGYYFRDDEVPDEGWAGPWPDIDTAIETAIAWGYVPVTPWHWPRPRQQRLPIGVVRDDEPG